MGTTMFSAVMNKAAQAIEAKLATIVGRAIIVVPFLIAAGFVTAATTIVLINSYGGVVACFALAAGFSLIGLIGLAVLNAQAPSVEEPAASAESVQQSSEPLMTTGALLGLLTTIGPANIAGLLRLAVRNLPLLAAAALVIVMAFNRNAATESAPTNSVAGAE
jgi:hypothetical protein